MLSAGKHLSIIDPGCRIYPPGITGGAGRSIAALGGDTELQVESAFPDSFAPWDFSGPLDFRRELNATLIRIPLRFSAQGGKASVSEVCFLVQTPL